MQKLYISERAIAFDVPKLGHNGLKIPVLNDYGNPRPGIFEEHECRFTPLDRKKVNGELVCTYIFIADEKTPKEVSLALEEMVKRGSCEHKETYDKRTNPDKAYALMQAEAHKERADKAESDNAKNIQKIAELEAKLEQIKNRNSGK